MGRRGDLLVFGDQISRCWKQIVQFRERSTDEQPSTSESGLSIESCPRPRSFSTGTPGLDWIVDERGVRLAEELSD